VEEGPDGPFYRLRLHLGKTNQLNKPDHRTIGPTGAEVCPFKITEQYLQRLGSKTCSLQPSCDPSDRARPHPTRVVPYTRALDDLRELLDGLGYNGKDYGEHSGKRGGATESSSKGIPENEIQEQGNWTCLTTARKYIEKSDKNSLAFIRKMI